MQDLYNSMLFFPSTTFYGRQPNYSSERFFLSRPTLRSSIAFSFYELDIDRKLGAIKENCKYCKQKKCLSGLLQ